MKFTDKLRFNAVPEWREYYINYAMLKKLVYQMSQAPGEGLEGRMSFDGAGLSGSFVGRGDLSVGSGRLEYVGREAAQLEEMESGPGGEREGSMRVPLLQTQRSLTPTTGANGGSFVQRLDQELFKIISFFNRHSSEFASALSQIELKAHGLDGIPDLADSPCTDDDFKRRVEYWYRPPPDAVRMREVTKPKLEELYVKLADLKRYVDLNVTGFRKILKKHDKEVDSEPIMTTYLLMVNQKLPVSRIKEHLDASSAHVVRLYAAMYCNGDKNKAERKLTSALKDEIEFERGTVWQDMVAQQRKEKGAAVRINEAGVLVPTKLALLKQYWQPVCLMLALVTFSVLLVIPIFDTVEKQNCLAMLVFVTILWCTEAIPLFATSMLLPLLIVVLGVLQDTTKKPPHRLTPPESAQAVFHSMFSQVIMLLLGGFAIAGALSKHFIAKQLAIAVISRVGRKPHNVLLANMMVATFASMWISNVAAPVLCFSIIQPILRTLPPGHAFSKSLVMGIALASNLGGMTSPISSPQNIFAIERMSMDGDAPSWLVWFAVALPVAVAGNLLCWGLILLVYQPSKSIKEVRPLKPNEDPMNTTQIFVIVVSISTVVMWCLNSWISQYTGEMGVLAIFPLVAFFGFGVLSKDDFNGFLWNVVMLAMGGLALGEAVKSSGLLLTIAQGIQEMVEGLDLWQVTMVFCALVLVGTTFISHTVGAMVILPIVQSVGEALPQPHPRLLVMASALMCSGAMGLPVSGFPNMNAVALEGPTGQTYVDTFDFLKVGVPGSVMTYGVIISVGYVLMKAVGF